ncbi:hypothetical protein XA68_10664 [Ophiocordyceps unilateralis]|uniref:Uncharacterized protein n=1 Tax=Ophiocordyceps unilateralis TaxID=268505 RepID=A0A2A9PGY8_OPHUN|nr:hypothetical protein XA68_10664 [Ophiocordyceps unilateralis]
MAAAAAPDEPPASSTTTTATAVGPSRPTSSPHEALRRVAAADDSMGLRQRRRLSPESDLGGRTATRRSSVLSDFSSDARDGFFARGPMLEPPQPAEGSTVASASLAFALLPAVAGVLFTNGHAVVTDIMLLALAGVFLHWSVTQPWVWYRAAQQVRLRHAGDADTAMVEADGDPNSHGDVLDDDVDVNDQPDAGPDSPDRQPTTTRRQAAAAGAVRELYLHEMLALLACLALPLASAYLLHAIRAQLSRPSEGLVSNYNLTIFLLVAELRVFSHILKLVHARTLHLQRVANADQLAPGPRVAPVDELAARIAVLEASARGSAMNNSSAQQAKNDAALTRDVRNAIQPELDALNRAVRRYEKKATLLQMQTEARFSGVDARLEDAVALAAAAAKHSALPRRRSSAVSILAAAVLSPFRLLLSLILLPLTLGRFLFARARGHPRQYPSATPARSGRVGGRASPRYDRVPTRVTRR